MRKQPTFFRLPRAEVSPGKSGQFALSLSIVGPRRICPPSPREGCTPRLSFPLGSPFRRVLVLNLQVVLVQMLRVFLCLSSLTSVNVTGCSPRANRHRVRGLMRAENVRRDRGSDCSAHIHAARLFDECGETLRRIRETPSPRLLPHRDQRG